MFTGVAWSGNMSSVAIAGQLGVPFATLLSVALLGERIHWRRWLGISLAFAGVLIIVVAAFIGAFGVIAIKRVRELNPLELQAWLAWASLPFLLPLSLWLEDGQIEALASADTIVVSAVLYSALMASVLAHTAYFALVHRYPVSSVAPVTVLAPLFSVLFSIWLLGDQIDWRLIIGGLMTLSGVAVIVSREGKAAPAA